MTTPSASRSRAGFTVLELTVTIVLFVGVMAMAVGILRSQGAAFRLGGARFDMTQNERFATGTLERALRSLGSGVVDSQPMLVYGSDRSLAFNADLVERIHDGFAVYYNPDAPLTSVDAWRVSAAGAIPGSAYIYPPRTFTMPTTLSPSRAETVIFYLTPDTTTARADDYVLMERFNADPAEVVARNLLQHPTLPFFQYLLQRRVGTQDTLVVAAGTEMPLKRYWPPAGNSSADTANAIRADSVRAVRFSFRVTNGKTGTDERTQPVSVIINLPNNGLANIPVCGDRPVAPGSINTTSLGGGKVRIDWTPSPDETGGQRDVVTYSIYRRLVFNPDWGSAIQSVRRGTVTFTDESPTVGSVYRYAVAATDCNPLESNPVVSPPVLVTP